MATEAADIAFSMSSTGEVFFSSSLTSEGEPENRDLKIVIRLNPLMIAQPQPEPEEAQSSPEITKQEYYPFLEKVEFMENIKRRHA